MRKNDKKFIELIENNASILINITPNLLSKDQHLQTLDNERFIRRLMQDILPKTDKTVILAVFEV